MSSTTFRGLRALYEARSRLPSATAADPPTLADALPELAASSNGHAHPPQPPPPVAPPPSADCMTEKSEPGRAGARVVERLKRRFGLGADPKKRLALYRRLERLHEVHGDLVLELISEAVAQAVAARAPGNYFCRAILAKLREARLFAGVERGSELW